MCGSAECVVCHKGIFELPVRTCEDCHKQSHFVQSKMPHWKTEKERDAARALLCAGGLDIHGSGYDQAGFYLCIDEISDAREQKIRDGQVEGVVWHDPNTSGGGFAVCPECARKKGMKCPACGKPLVEKTW